MNVWYMPAESNEWVGPIVVMNNGVPVVSGWKVQVVLQGVRPDPSLWTDPVVDPGGSGALGVYPGVVNQYQIGRYRIWIKVIGTNEQPVRDDSGLIIRT